MSVHVIYMKDGAKHMRPVTSRTEYVQLRNAKRQQTILKQVRGGFPSMKSQLLQMNYSCLPNDDGTLKGSKRTSDTVGMDIDHIPAQQMQTVKERILDKRDELRLLMLERSATRRRLPPRIPPPPRTHARGKPALGKSAARR